MTTRKEQRDKEAQQRGEGKDPQIPGDWEPPYLPWAALCFSERERGGMRRKGRKGEMEQEKKENISSILFKHYFKSLLSITKQNS